MADEKELSSGSDRPVEPPVIDLEAEEVDKASDSAAEQRAADAPAGGRNRDWLRNLSPVAVIFGAAIILAIAGIWTVLSSIDFRGGRTDQTLTPRLEALEAASEQMQRRIGEFTAAISELKEQPTQPAGVDPMEQAAIKQQLRQLESGIGALNQAIEQIGASLKMIESGQNAQEDEIKSAAGLIGELQSRLSRERQQVAADNASGNELASALMKLKAAAEEGQPFGGELEALNAMMPDAAGSAGIAELRPVSTSGIPKKADLADRLRRVLEELRTPATAQAEAGAPSGLWDTFKSKAKSLISVRKLEDARWLDAAESAMERVKEGDLRGAMQILSSVEGKPPPAVETWLKDAAARLKVEEAIEELSAGVLKQLGSGS